MRQWVVNAAVHPFGVIAHGVGHAQIDPLAVEATPLALPVAIGTFALSPSGQTQQSSTPISSDRFCRCDGRKGREHGSTRCEMQKFCGGEVSWRPPLRHQSYPNLRASERSNDFRFCAGFGRRQRRSNHVLRCPAAEKAPRHERAVPPREVCFWRCCGYNSTVLDSPEPHHLTQTGLNPRRNPAAQRALSRSRIAGPKVKSTSCRRWRRTWLDCRSLIDGHAD
jgi:hypothetical protein